MNVMDQTDTALHNLATRIERAILDAHDAGCTEIQIARTVADAARTYGFRVRIKPHFGFFTEHSLAERDAVADGDRNWDGT